jgi:diacylglycerol kinase
LAATGIVFVLGLVSNLQRLEWCLLIIAILIVWIAEGMNTALEAIADAVHPDHHPLIGRAKDVAAAAVLIAAVGSVFIGILIFGNHVKAWF